MYKRQTPTKKGSLGTKELNKNLQEALNPRSDLKGERQYGEQIYRVGDRVMQIKNNYDIYWTKGEENGTGIFNGEIGRIAHIDHEAKQIKIIYDDEKNAWYQFSELEQIEHAYAITIHKAQRLSLIHIFHLTIKTNGNRGFEIYLYC